MDIVGASHVNALAGLGMVMVIFTYCTSPADAATRALPRYLQDKPSPSPSSPSDGGGGSGNKNYVIGAVIGVVVGALIVGVGFAVYFYWRCTRNQRARQGTTPPLDMAVPVVNGNHVTAPPEVQFVMHPPHLTMVQQPSSNESTSHDILLENNMSDHARVEPWKGPPGQLLPPPPSSSGELRSGPTRPLGGSRLALGGAVSGSGDLPPSASDNSQGPPSMHGEQLSSGYNVVAVPGPNSRGNLTGKDGPSSSTSNTQPQAGSSKQGAAGGGLVMGRAELQKATGLPAGDPFLRHVAPHYRWCMQPIERLQPVEEGVNAATVASHALLKNWHIKGTTRGPDPQKLSPQEVQEQIELLTAGLLGRGGTAVVFRCRWPRKFGTGHMLAAKIMMNSGGSYDHQRELSSFKHEADVLYRCSHRNVVRLYGYCLEPPNVCLIMELLPSSLEARLYGSGLRPPLGPGQPPRLGPSVHISSVARQEDQLPSHKGAPMKMKEVLLISRDIAEGLAHLHAKEKDDPLRGQDDDEEEDPTTALSRVIHRDLKPANVLINSKGVAKISDFGLARENPHSTGLETNNPQMGTLRYMAPELITSLACAKLTPKVDIYSLAILMWEMVARKVPWHEFADLQVPLQVYSGKRPGTPGFIPPEPGSANLDLTNFGPHTVAEMEVSIAAPLNNLPPADSEPAFNTFPAFSTIIHACWQPNPRARPSAATVYKQLQLLVEAAGINNRKQ